MDGSGCGDAALYIAPRTERTETAQHKGWFAGRRDKPQLLPIASPALAKAQTVVSDPQPWFPHHLPSPSIMALP